MGSLLGGRFSSAFTTGGGARDSGQRESQEPPTESPPQNFFRKLFRKLPKVSATEAKAAEKRLGRGTGT